MEGVIGSVASLAHLAWETCAASSQYKQECLRIGNRLQQVVVLCKQWTHAATVNNNNNKNNKNSTTTTHPLPSKPALQTLRNVLVRTNMILQAATTDRSTWTKRVQTYAASIGLLQGLQQAEKELDAALQDFVVAQNVDLMRTVMEHQAQLLTRFQRVENILMQNNQSQVEEMNDYVQELQRDASNRSTAAATTTSSTTSTTTTNAPATATTGTTSSLESGGAWFDDDVVPFVNDATTQLLLVDKSKVNFGQYIDEGTFGEVYQGYYQGEKVAIKQLKASIVSGLNHDPTLYTSLKRKMYKEAALVSHCGICPKIVQMYGFYSPTEASVDRPFLVMELMGETLFHAIQKNLLPSLQVRVKLLRDVAEGLEFLHSQGVVHRDIKSNNILLSNDLTVAKLSDFGEAKEKGLGTTAFGSNGRLSAGGSGRQQQHAGTLHYHPPEILNGSLVGASRKAEMYAFGVVVWECLTSQIPHYGKQDFDIIRMALDPGNTYLLDIPDNPQEREVDFEAEEVLRSLACQCLVRDPSQRPTATTAVFMLGRKTLGNVALGNNDVIPPKDEVLAWTDQSSQNGQASPGFFAKRKFYIAGFALVLIAAVALIAFLAAGSDDNGTESGRNPGGLLQPTVSPVETDNTLPTASPAFRETTDTISPTPGDFEWVQFGPNIFTDFPRSMALSGDGRTIARGDGIGDNLIEISQFNVAANRWQPLGQDLTGQQANPDSFSLSSSGLVLATALQNTTDRENSFATVRAYTYDQTSARWLRRGQDIVGAGGSIEYIPTTALSSDGSVLLATMYVDDAVRGTDLQVRTFSYNTVEEQWVQFGQNLHGGNGRWYGNSVALSANGYTMVAGFPGWNKNDFAFVRVSSFDDTSQLWVQLGQDIHGENYFGEVVALSADGLTVAAGLPGKLGTEGYVRIYKYTRSLDSWQQVGQEIKWGESGRVALALAADGNRVAVGAPDYGDKTGSDSSGCPAAPGRVRVYQYTQATNEWKQIGGILELYDNTVNFGEKVAMSNDGTTVAATLFVSLASKTCRND